MNTRKGLLVPIPRKNANGTIEITYFDPEYKNAEEFKKAIYSIALGIRLIDGEISTNRAIKTIDSYLNSNYAGLSASRRNFLKTALLTALTAGFSSCDKDEPLDQIVIPPTPLISGPAELTIPKVGRGVRGTFDSAGTKDADDIYWKINRPLSGMNSVELRGSGFTKDLPFAVPGANEVILLAQNKGGISTISQDVKINPPGLPEQKYDLPMILRIHDSMNEQGAITSAIYTLDLQTNELTRIFSGDRYYGYGSWEPSGQRMALVTYPGPKLADYPKTPYKITTYDFIKGSFIDISNNTSGIAWSPSWSPKGDWIAYLDDSKSQAYSRDVMALMRPDGSDQFYLDGSGQTSEYSAQSLSWDPEGNRLIGGANQSRNFKMVIFDKLFDGKPVITSILPLEDQIDRYYDAESARFMETGLEKDLFKELFYLGTNGVAWSPDGQYVAYNAVFGLDPYNYYELLLSRIDGTGDIQMIATSNGNSGVTQDLWYPLRPTWTPDGSTIYFAAQRRGIDTLYKYDVASKNTQVVSLPLTRVSWPSLYG